MRRTCWRRGCLHLTKEFSRLAGCYPSEVQRRRTHRSATGYRRRISLFHPRVRQEFLDVQRPSEPQGEDASRQIDGRRLCAARMLNLSRGKIALSVHLARVRGHSLSHHRGFSRDRFQIPLHQSPARRGQRELSLGLHMVLRFLREERREEVLVR